MNLTVAETQALIAILTLIVTIAPTMALTINVYLRSKVNEMKLQEKPSHTEVEKLIDAKVQTVLRSQANDTTAD